MFDFAHFILLELTYDCNLRCRYCYLGKNRDSETMPFNIFKRIIDKIVAKRKFYNDGRSTTIELHGGEPLVVGENYICKAMRYVYGSFVEANLPLKLCMQTNGTLLTKRIVETAKKTKCDIGISLDGIGFHNSLRTPNNQVLKDTKHAFDVIQACNEKVGVVSVVSSMNIDSVSQLHEELSKDYFCVTHCKMVDMFDVFGNHNEVKPEDFFDAVIVPLCNKFLRGQTIYHDSWGRVVHRAIQNVFVIHSDTCQSTCGFRFCGSGVNILSVGPDGTVYSCDRMSEKVRNKSVICTIDDSDFLGLKELRYSVHFLANGSLIQRKYGCDSCVARYVCGGTCQKLYETATGHMGIRTFDCSIYRKIYKWAGWHCKELADSIYQNHGGKLEIIEDYVFAERKPVFLKVGYDCDISKDGRSITLKPMKREYENV